MGTVIHLKLGEYPVDWTKNGLGKDHGSLFQNSDIKFIKEDEFEPVEILSKKLGDMVDRLELLGYTIENARYEYEKYLQEYREEDGTLPTFDEIKKYLSDVCISEVRGNSSEGYKAARFIPKEFTDRLSENSECDSPKYDSLLMDYWELDLLLEHLSPYSVLRIFAENTKNHEIDVTWDFGYTVESGWVDRRQFFQNARDNQKFLIVTEGSSDAKIIQKALFLLNPNILDFFTFVDMKEGYPFSGTGNLYKFVQGLISIGIQNNIVILYDNDTEGCDKYEKTLTLNIPHNMKVIKLPDLDSLNNFKTMGPSGFFDASINGRASSIECFLDLSCDSNDEPFVRWTSYQKESQKYQGSLENKTKYMRKFLKMNEISPDYQYNKINILLEFLVKKCTEIAEAKNIAEYYWT